MSDANRPLDIEQADIPDGDPTEWTPEQKHRILKEAAELDLPDEFTDYAEQMAQSLNIDGGTDH